MREGMKFPSLTLSISIIVIALYVIFGNTPENLIWITGDAFQRPWSLVTAHLVHISTEHLIWNVAAFSILSSIIEQTSKQDVFLALGVGMLGVNFYLLFLFPLAAYAGLSGVLNTLLVVALYHLSSKENYAAAAMLTLVASMAKVILELTTSSSIFSSLPWPAVPQAHLVGWLVGAAFVGVQHGIKDRWNIKVQNSHTSLIKT